MDKDCNNYVDYSEFLTASVSKTKLLGNGNLDTAFSLFDKDNSGEITIEELKQVFDLSGCRDNQIWIDIMHEVDADGDGVISFHEFK
jgi:calcium-dependent protein kinase